MTELIPSCDSRGNNIKRSWYYSTRFKSSCNFYQCFHSLCEPAQHVPAAAVLKVRLMATRTQQSTVTVFIVLFLFFLVDIHCIIMLRKGFAGSVVDWVRFSAFIASLHASMYQ